VGALRLRAVRVAVSRLRCMTMTIEWRPWQRVDRHRDILDDLKGFLLRPRFPSNPKSRAAPGCDAASIEP
jgi:hypothetical protein